MKVLAINCGSSTLKFDLLETAGEDKPRSPERRLAHGTVDRIGPRAALKFVAKNSVGLQESASVADHGEAARVALGWLDSTGLYKPRLGAVGHRVVHGGDRFLEPTLIDDEVISAIEALSDLAPLHNEPSLMAIRAARSALGPSVPMVAVFDTAFYSTMPELASRYAIPQELAAKHRIRRYGFHGLAHRYMVERYAAIASRDVRQAKLITLQLGNGCSVTAVEGGRSVDTSMGFTPLEGLMMGTRSGDVDPSLAGFLARKESVKTEEVEGWLNLRAGLLGISGVSRDMREILEAERQGNAHAALAVAMFCYRVRKYIGAYMAVLGRADAVVFGGGIGENSPEVRGRICAGMDWCGLKLDGHRNTAIIGIEGKISADDATVHVYVIPVDEALIIARDTVRCLSQRQSR
jgi:acetate kinase